MSAFPIDSPPLNRIDALAAWRKFLPHVPGYGPRRNFVNSAHNNVSQLSFAIRHRLLLEDEVIAETLTAHNFTLAEKWLQEVCWRRYWKGWLEQRPDVWTSWRTRVRELRQTLPESVLQRAAALEEGRSDVACMDAIARELTTTGYIHNHARMWWASYWIHCERLPWELGADVFFRHLLDADPASNTLSWRWVAGLQTPGKTYLVRLSNLEKYAPELVENFPEGKNRIADGIVLPAQVTEYANTTRQPLQSTATALAEGSRRVGLWLHADDLLPEVGPLSALRPTRVASFSSDVCYREQYGLSDRRIAALNKVLAEAVHRASDHFQSRSNWSNVTDSAASIVSWAATHGLDEVVAFSPTVGPVRDLVPRLSCELSTNGIALSTIRRPSDAHAFSLAAGGFFPFWEKMSRHLRSLSPLLAPSPS